MTGGFTLYLLACEVAPQRHFFSVLSLTEPLFAEISQRYLNPRAFVHLDFHDNWGSGPSSASAAVPPSIVSVPLVNDLLYGMITFLVLLKAITN